MPPVIHDSEKNSELYLTHSFEETFRLAEHIAKDSKAGEVYTLNGELGAGKTVFAQGFAVGLGIQEPVNSPTFTIMNVYDSGRLPLYHFDLYRLQEEEELYELGMEEYLYGSGVCLIEWASLFPNAFPMPHVNVNIQKTDGEDLNQREIRIYSEA